MRQTRPEHSAAETTGARTPRFRPILVLAVSLLALGSNPVVAEGNKAGSACSQRYHASLERIADEEYQSLKAARHDGTALAANPADPDLPGNLLFPPVSVGERTREETAALRLAASLARGKGRLGGGTTSDAAWMADRLRVALGDYLTQSPSPYLCSGVKDYVADLRRDAGRLGPPPIQREALLAIQKDVVARTVAAAYAVMKPVGRPSDKPADHPTGKPMEELRPAAGLERTDTGMETGFTAALRPDDPDLPKLPPQPAERYDTPADLVAAIDRLEKTAQTGRFLDKAPLTTLVGATPVIPAARYPVLSRLSDMRSIVIGVRPRVTDRIVRLRLASALSAIEALDYIMRVRTDAPDPLATAMDATFEAILKAHSADCTCRD